MAFVYRGKVPGKTRQERASIIRSTLRRTQQAGLSNAKVTFRKGGTAKVESKQLKEPITINVTPQPVTRRTSFEGVKSKAVRQAVAQRLLDRGEIITKGSMAGRQQVLARQKPEYEVTLERKPGEFVGRKELLTEEQVKRFQSIRNKQKLRNIIEDSSFAVQYAIANPDKVPKDTSLFRRSVKKVASVGVGIKNIPKNFKAGFNKDFDSNYKKLGTKQKIKFIASLIGGEVSPYARGMAKTFEFQGKALKDVKTLEKAIILTRKLKKAELDIKKKGKTNININPEIKYLASRIKVRNLKPFLKDSDVQKFGKLLVLIGVGAVAGPFVSKILSYGIGKFGSLALTTSYVSQVSKDAKKRGIIKASTNSIIEIGALSLGGKLYKSIKGIKKVPSAKVQRQQIKQINKLPKQKRSILKKYYKKGINKLKTKLRPKKQLTKQEKLEKSFSKIKTKSKKLIKQRLKARKEIPRLKKSLKADFKKARLLLKQGASQKKITKLKNIMIKKNLKLAEYKKLVGQTPKTKISKAKARKKFRKEITDYLKEVNRQRLKKIQRQTKLVDSIKDKKTIKEIKQIQKSLKKSVLSSKQRKAFRKKIMSKLKKVKKAEDRIENLRKIAIRNVRNKAKGQAKLKKSARKKLRRQITKTNNLVKKEQNDFKRLEKNYNKFLDVMKRLKNSKKGSQRQLLLTQQVKKISPVIKRQSSALSTKLSSKLAKVSSTATTSVATTKGFNTIKTAIEILGAISLLNLNLQSDVARLTRQALDRVSITKPETIQDVASASAVDSALAQEVINVQTLGSANKSIVAQALTLTPALASVVSIPKLLKGKTDAGGFSTFAFKQFSSVPQKSFIYLPDLQSIVYGLKANNSQARRLTSVGRIFTGTEIRRVI